MTDPAHTEFQRQFLSELLTARAAELAERAACDLLASHPQLEEVYKPVPRLKWQDHFHGRIGDLAAAIWAGRPEVIASQVAWAGGAFAARGVPLEHLRLSLASLEATLSRAVALEDAPLLAQYLGDASRTLDQALPGPAPDGHGLAARTAAGRVAASYLKEVLEGDRLAAARVVLDAVRSGLGVREAYLDVLIPAQEELGRLWYMGELSIAEEHAATAATQLVMGNLIMLADREPPDGRVALTAAVRSNTHDIAVRIVGDLLEMAGWRVVSLGADVPAEELALACADFGVHLVALSVSMPSHLRELEEAVLVLGACPARPRILVGGRALRPCPDLWAGLGADAYAPSAAAAVELAGGLVPPPASQPG